MVFLLKLVLKSFYLLLIVLLFIIVTEAGLFYSILKTDAPVEKADAVVVFNAGGLIREQEGYRLVNKGYAPLLIVSPTSEKTRKTYDSRYGHDDSWRHLIEEKADTTFQNALFVSRLIREKDLKTIILVTDAYHMPRSCLLLHMMLIGADVRISVFKTGDKYYGDSALKWSTRQKKWIFNESLKFWGSMSEMGLYFAHVKLPEKSYQERAWVKALRNLILLDMSAHSS